jgi:hypothetical protein
MYDAFTTDAELHAVHGGAEPDSADGGHRHRAVLRPRHPRLGVGIRGKAQRRGDGETVVPTAEKPVAAQWAAWAKNQHFTGNGAVPDFANPEQMNRYTWYQAHQWTVPYPGDTKIYTPSQAPGGHIPSNDTN